MLLNEAGIEYGRAAIGAWEDGRNVPDALVLRRLAKIYGQSTDALLWDDAASMEAMQWAAQFDGLKPAQQERLRAIWMAFIAEAADDSTVESRMPITQERPGAVIIDEALLDGPPRRRSSRT